MTGFTSEWLALREPSDAAARDASITTRLAQLLQQNAPHRFFDLGCGTGANYRYLAPKLGGAQVWELLDSDEHLLADADALAASGGTTVECTINTRRIDLARDLHQVVFTDRAVVTASALLDLVSAEWLTQLLEQCSASKAIVLFALSYDGRISLSPFDADDEWIRDRVNLHQRTDKGFGTALGPAAVGFALDRLVELDYNVQSAPSDWTLDAGAAGMQEHLLRGWAQAALEVEPVQELRCERWLRARLEHVARGDSLMRVGHEDLIGWRA